MSRDTRRLQVRQAAVLGDRGAVLDFLVELDRACVLPQPGDSQPAVMVTLRAQPKSDEIDLVPCSTCTGRGRTLVFPRPCEDCNGTGEVPGEVSLRVHPWRTQQRKKLPTRRPSYVRLGTWWTPCRAVDIQRPCSHCKGDGKLSQDCECAICTTARIVTTRPDCPRCKGTGQGTRVRNMGTPGRYYLCPTTDRGQCFWTNDRSLAFDALPELIEWLAERLYTWKIK